MPIVFSCSGQLRRGAVPPPTQPPEGDNAYFDTLMALPQLFHGRSLRDTAHLTEMGNADGDWSYDPGGDTYTDPQDGAKLTYPIEKTSLGPDEGLWLGVWERTAGDTFLFIWDFWWGPEWRSIESCGGSAALDNVLSHAHKEFRVYLLRTTQNEPSTGDIAFEVRVNYTKGDGTGETTCDGIGLVDMRIYQTPEPEPVTNVNSYDPTGQGALDYKTFAIKHSTWTRFWLELKLNVDETNFPEWNADNSVTLAAGTWHRFSLWAADEGRDPQRLYYRCPSGRVNGPNTRDGIARFYLEHNSSTNPHTAHGDGRFTGVVGTLIPSNTLVQRTSETARRYTTDDPANIGGGGFVDVPMTAVANVNANGGPQGNQPNGTDMDLVTPITDVDDHVEAVTEFTGGAWIATALRYAYARNYVCLKNYTLPATPETDTTIFQRPNG